MGGLPGSRKYVLGVYEQGKLKQTFRTETEYAISAVRSEAEKCKRWLQEEYPERDYEVKEIKQSENGAGGWCFR